MSQIEGGESYRSYFLLGLQVDFQTVPHVLELAWHHQSSSSLQVCPQTRFPVRTNLASRTSHPAMREPVLPVTGPPGCGLVSEVRVLNSAATPGGAIETEGVFVLGFFHRPSRIRYFIFFFFSLLYLIAPRNKFHSNYQLEIALWSL